MSPWNKPLPLVALLLTLVTPVSRLAAADKLNLDRVTPVPATEQIPVMDFFRAALLTSPKLNPSGTDIAALITGNVDKHRLLTYNLKTQKIDTLEGSGDKDIYFFEWLNDKRLVYFLSAEKLYGLGLFAADVGRLHDSYALIQYYGASLIAVPPADRTHPLVWLSFDGLETYKEVGAATIDTDIRSGHLINLTRADISSSDIMDARDNNDRHIIKRYSMPQAGMNVGYLADKEGRLEFAFTSDKGLFYLHHLVDQKWVKCPVDLEYTDVLGCGNEPGQLIVLAPREPGKPQALRFMEGATGKMGDVIFQDSAYDFAGWFYRDPVSHNVVGINFERNGPKTVWFDESYRNLQKVLDGFFPGLVVRILGGSENGKIFLVSTSSDRQPVAYSWVDLEKRAVGLVKSAAPWIDPKRMQPMNIMKFKTKEGMQLDAYLTLPAGTSKQNPAPLVVLPHGGPWVRDNWGFDGEVQFLVSRGYAVLQPNYRGSTGSNWMFPEDDQYEFVKMHDDVTAATKTVLTSGLIDPKRVAIMGGSFGGYLALSGVVREPALYRCAVTIAGVFDWKKMMKQEKYYQYDNPAYARLMRKLGDPSRDTAKFDAISPVRHVDQVRVPVFVAHGKDDPVSDIEQSKLLVSELEKYHVPFEKLFVGGEGHGMGHLNNEVELYTRIEAFLAKNLAPIAAPPAATGTP